MSTHAVDFLNELSETESISALQNAYSQKSILVFKIDEYLAPIKAQIENFNDRKVLLNKEVADLKFDLSKEISMKFNIGTEVFFIKTFLKKNLNRIYFDMSSKVIQLKRRKEPRYVIPKKWNQTSSILNNSMALNLLKCHVHDISYSGIRLEVDDKKAPVFEKEEIIKIQFQIYKRAEVATDAIVRFYLKKVNENSLVGLEFVNLKEIQRQKVQDIVEDLINFQSSPKY
jgi:hypothetical protein